MWTLLPLAEATLMAHTATSGQPASANFLCQPCRLHWLNRPHFSALNGLIGTWNDLHVCLPAGKTVMWLIDRITLWQTKACSELTVSVEQLPQNKNTGMLVRVSYC